MPLDAETVQFNLDVVYFMLAIGLVFIMQAGFAMLETGLTRSKNAANIVMKNTSDFTVGILVYFFVGFGVMYGASVGGLFGSDSFMLLPGSYSEAGLAGDPFLAVDFLYQAVFAATAATIVSGAVAERMRFPGYLIMSAAMTAVIYPVVGFWNWGGGWLSELGFVDFAGSTIVHATGGIAALVGAAILGPRIGKFGPDGKPRAMPGHSAPLIVLGMFILFFGWFGFNGGSVLAADGVAIAPVLLNTALAGAAGGVTAMAYTWLRFRKPDVSMTCNGVLAGLVGVTAGPDAYGPIAAIAVGLVAGVLVAVSVAAVDRMRIDDAVGAFSVHGVCGVLGTWWVGFYAADGGLFTGGGADLIIAQVVGTVAVTVWVTVTVAALFLGLKAAGLLRVSEEEEIEGLDIHEHGMYGYPELALGPQAYPGGPATSVVGHAVARTPPAPRQAASAE
ncbi:MAG: ammonium transporter [Egibacteraceae bacterium]